MSKKTSKRIFQICHICAYILPILSCLVGVGLLIYYPLLGFRFQLVALVLVLLAIFLVAMQLAYRKHKRVVLYVFMVLSVLYGLGITYCDYIFYRAVHTMSTISTQAGDIVSAGVYTLNDSELQTTEDLKGRTIALQPESNESTSTMITDGLQEDGFSESDLVTTTYANYVEAYNALLNGDVDAIALDAGGISMIEQVYPDVTDQIRSIVSYQRIVHATASDDKANLSTEPFTLLINGVDIRNGNLNEAANADVIMLATFNPQTMKLSLNSIPRDTYIPVTCQGQRDKITHSGSGGINCTIESIENAFDIKIDYYVKLNFYAVVDLVDAIGGIDVDVPITFTEQDSHDNADAIHLEAGENQHLNGEEALALARHRKTLLRGDIDRGINQQIVIEGILRKLASGKIVTSVDSLLSVVGDNVQTNMSPQNMYSLFSLLTNLGSNSRYGDMSALNIQSHTLEGTDLYKTESWSGGQEIYYFVPNESSINATTLEIKRIIGEEPYPLPTSKFSFNANVPYEKADIDLDELVYDNAGSSRRTLTVPDFEGDTYADVRRWCSNNETTVGSAYAITCEYRTTDGTELNDDSRYESGSVEAGEVLSADNMLRGTKTLIFHFTGDQNSPQADAGYRIIADNLRVRTSDSDRDLLAILPYYVTDLTGKRIASSQYTATIEDDEINWQRAGTYRATLVVTSNEDPSLTASLRITVTVYSV